MDVNKKLKEVLKTLVFIPAGLLTLALILAIAGGIDWVIFQIIDSINPNQGNLLDGARGWGVILLTLAAFVIACFGLLMGSGMYFYVSTSLSPDYIKKKILLVVIVIIFLIITYFIFSAFYSSIPEESSIFTWIAFIIGILSMIVPGIAGAVGIYNDKS